ncbi:MAG: hypothetical protein U5P10_14160 [Spirochaetia bacterium]|nr:hypothetical protein [Spirochaetia bacterium]
MTGKILLVENEAPIALNEARMLKKFGYEVVIAYTGEEALNIAEEESEISLILISCMLLINSQKCYQETHLKLFVQPHLQQ